MGCADVVVVAADLMKAEAKIQVALALLGIPAIFWFWRADAKWPNPFVLQSKPASERKPSA